MSKIVESDILLIIKIVSATLEAILIPKLMTGFEGHTDGYYFPQKLNIFKALNHFDIYRIPLASE